MIFDSYNYVVNAKTTDAELKGLSYLESHVFDRTLVMLELTKSRITSRNPLGTIHRRIAEVEDLVGEMNFFLDLTTHEDLQNIEIEDLIDEKDGYNAWVSFVEDLSAPGVIPVIQAILGGSSRNLRMQAESLLASFGRTAIRLDSSLNTDETRYVCDPVFNVAPGPDSVCIIVDCGFVHVTRWRSVRDELVDQFRLLVEQYPGAPLVVLASSFPKSVTQAGYGDDEDGVFDLAEVLLSDDLRREFTQIHHGDYGSIHPVRYSGGGGWVPRVDVPLERECFYHRYRREDGGYIRAAREVIEDEYYNGIGAWGDDEIQQAAAGTPNGRSPQHWIAVRENLHITRQFLRLSDHL